MSSKEPCANVYFLQREQARIEASDRRHEEQQDRFAELESEVMDQTARLVEDIGSDTLIDIFNEVLTNSENPEPNELLLEDLAAHLCVYFADSTHENAKDLGHAFANYIHSNAENECRDKVFSDEII